MLLKKIIRFCPLFYMLFSWEVSWGQTAAGMPAPDTTRTDAFLEELLGQYPQYFKEVLANRAANNVQVIYTKIDRGANGIAGLKNFYLDENAGHYFYPGMAAKLPVAVFTCQKLAELKQYGVDKNTTMLTEKAYSGQTAVYNDPTTSNGKPSIHQYFKRMMVGNDAEAFNRLYELAGQQFINDQLNQKGYSRAQLAERIGNDLTAEEDRHTNPVAFYAPGNKLLYRQPAQNNTRPFAVRKDTVGKTDFSLKNKLVLQDLQEMLVSLVFPNKVTASRRFNITEEDRRYILQYMSQPAAEMFSPPYIDDTATYYPSYGKLLLYGAGKDSVKNNLRIFNVTGEDYGQLVDVSYIVDLDKKIEFFLAAVFNCNTGDTTGAQPADEEAGLSFMKHLGQVIYDYETGREKKIQPDLTDVKFIYDGR